MSVVSPSNNTDVIKKSGDRFYKHCGLGAILKRGIFLEEGYLYF